MILLLSPRANGGGDLAAPELVRQAGISATTCQRIAEDLTARLIARDPLSERVHHRPLEVAGLAIAAGFDQIAGRRGAGTAALAGGAE